MAAATDLPTIQALTAQLATINAALLALNGDGRVVGIIVTDPNRVPREIIVRTPFGNAAYINALGALQTAIRARLAQLGITGA